VGDAKGVASTPHHSVYAPSVYHRPYNLKTIASEFIMPPGIIKAFRKMRTKMGGATPFQ
jgi:hypothetical protein